jgi:hypothetical protein
MFTPKGSASAHLFGPAFNKDLIQSLREALTNCFEIYIKNDDFSTEDLVTEILDNTFAPMIGSTVTFGSVGTENTFAGSTVGSGDLGGGGPLILRHIDRMSFILNTGVFSLCETLKAKNYFKDDTTHYEELANCILGFYWYGNSPENLDNLNDDYDKDELQRETSLRSSEGGAAKQSNRLASEQLSGKINNNSYKNQLIKIIDDNSLVYNEETNSLLVDEFETFNNDTKELVLNILDRFLEIKNNTNETTKDNEFDGGMFQIGKPPDKKPPDKKPPGKKNREKKTEKKPSQKNRKENLSVPVLNGPANGSGTSSSHAVKASATKKRRVVTPSLQFQAQADAQTEAKADAQTEAKADAQTEESVRRYVASSTLKAFLLNEKTQVESNANDRRALKRAREDAVGNLPTDSTADVKHARSFTERVLNEGGRAQTITVTKLHLDRVQKRFGELYKMLCGNAFFHATYKDKVSTQLVHKGTMLWSELRILIRDNKDHKHLGQLISDAFSRQCWGFQPHGLEGITTAFTACGFMLDFYPLFIKFGFISDGNGNVSRIKPGQLGQPNTVEEGVISFTPEELVSFQRDFMEILMKHRTPLAATPQELNPLFLNFVIAFASAPQDRGAVPQHRVEVNIHNTRIDILQIFRRLNFCVRSSHNILEMSGMTRAIESAPVIGCRDLLDALCVHEVTSTRNPSLASLGAAIKEGIIKDRAKSDEPNKKLLTLPIGQAQGGKFKPTRAFEFEGGGGGGGGGGVSDPTPAQEEVWRLFEMGEWYNEAAQHQGKAAAQHQGKAAAEDPEQEEAEDLGKQESSPP